MRNRAQWCCSGPCCAREARGRRAGGVRGTDGRRTSDGWRVFFSARAGVLRPSRAYTDAFGGPAGLSWSQRSALHLPSSGCGVNGRREGSRREGFSRGWRDFFARALAGLGRAEAIGKLPRCAAVARGCWPARRPRESRCQRRAAAARRVWRGVLRPGQPARRLRLGARACEALRNDDDSAESWTRLAQSPAPNSRVRALASERRLRGRSLHVSGVRLRRCKTECAGSSGPPRGSPTRSRRPTRRVACSS